MAETQLLFLSDPSRELVATIDRNGPIQCFTTPSIYLMRPPKLDDTKGGRILFPSNIDGLNRDMQLAISSTQEDGSLYSMEDIKHHLELVAIALHLAKPTPDFLEYWMVLDADGWVRYASSSIRMLPAHSSYMYLEYQQHHTITEQDVQRVIGILPLLSLAMERHAVGSWDHPYGSVHRAIIFFCQGYAVEVHPLPQVMWAAGLDSLFASKLDRGKQGAREISRRMQRFWGANFDPYTADTVVVPINQGRPARRLQDVAEHIFWLRNTYIHGGSIPDTAWLTNPRDPPEVGYAYQLVECSEILLRVALLRILEDQTLLDTFRDPAALDTYF
jgi:hypothetical protein